MGVRLPAEYQEVEYLESTGTQYIDTGFVADINSSFKCKAVMRRSDTAGSYVSIFGATTNTKNGYRIMVPKRQVQFQASENCETGVFLTANSSPVDFELSNGRLVLNGTTYTYKSYHSQGNIPIYLFASCGDNQVNGPWYWRIFDFRINSGTQKILEFVPCYRKSDNKPGMYDLVTKQFLVNQGTGEFIVGPDVIDSISPWLVARRRMLMRRKDELPAAYRRLHYLESDGAAYINTLLAPANDMTHVVKFQFTKPLSSDRYATVFGCYSAGSRARCQFNYAFDGVLGWGRAFDRYTGNYDNNEHIAVISNASFLVDNINIYTPTSSDFSVASGSIKPIVLFGTNSNGTVNSDTITDGLRISSYKVYRDGAIRRNFIPCIRKSDGAKGMYEAVGKVFRANAGSGEFSGN